jgi:hypothetical protein
VDRRLSPENIGADQALERVATLGSKLGIASILTALWPATAYGSGLERAFDRLGPKADRSLEGLRGRGMFLLVILPTFILGSLVGSFLGTVALGTSGVARIVGYVVALLFVALGANFEAHYATSGLAGLVLLAVWLFLSNALILTGYRVALES